VAIGLVFEEEDAAIERTKEVCWDRFEACTRVGSDTIKEIEMQRNSFLDSLQIWLHVYIQLKFQT
jgi:hypothetical protein